MGGEGVPHSRTNYAPWGTPDNRSLILSGAGRRREETPGTIPLIIRIIDGQSALSVAFHNYGDVYYFDTAPRASMRRSGKARD
jgi:hypothetical protein